VNHIARPTSGVCEDTWQTICLLDSKINCLICSLVFRVVCKPHSQKPQQA
jgi:hypothetical protein